MLDKLNSIKLYLRNLFIVIDQGINTVAGGQPDCTISACSYRYHNEDRFWYIMQIIINFSFYPFDGEGHCKQAYDNDNENYNKGGVVRKFIIAIVALPFCMVLSILISWPWYIISTGTKEFIKFCRGL